MAKLVRYFLCISPATEDKGTSTTKLYGSSVHTPEKKNSRVEYNALQNTANIKPRGVSAWHFGWWESKVHSHQRREVKTIWTYVSGENMSPKEYFDLLDTLSPPEPPDSGVSLQEVVVAEPESDFVMPVTIAVKTNSREHKNPWRHCEETSLKDKKKSSEKELKIEVIETNDSAMEIESNSKSPSWSLAFLATQLNGLRRFVRGSRDRMPIARTFSARLASRSSTSTCADEGPFINKEHQIYTVQHGSHSQMSSWSDSSLKLPMVETPCILSCQVNHNGEKSTQILGRNLPGHDPNCFCREQSVAWLISLDPQNALPPNSLSDLFSSSSITAYPFDNRAPIDNLPLSTSFPYPYSQSSPGNSNKNLAAHASPSYPRDNSGSSPKIAHLSGFIRSSTNINAVGTPSRRIASVSRITSFTRESPSSVAITSETEHEVETSEEIERKLSSDPLVHFTSDKLSFPCVPFVPVTEGNETKDSDLVYLTLVIQGRVISVYKTQMDPRKKDVLIGQTDFIESSNISSSEVVLKEVSCQTKNCNVHPRLAQETTIEHHFVPRSSDLVDRSVSAANFLSGSDVAKNIAATVREEAHAKMDEIMLMLGTMENLLQNIVIPSVNSGRQPCVKLQTATIDIKENTFHKFSGAGDDSLAAQLGRRDCEKIEKWVKDDFTTGSDLFQSEVVSDCAAPYSDKITTTGLRLLRSPSLEDFGCLLERRRNEISDSPISNNKQNGNHQGFLIARSISSYDIYNATIKGSGKMAITEHGELKKSKEIIESPFGIKIDNCILQQKLSHSTEKCLVRSLSSIKEEPDEGQQEDLKPPLRLPLTIGNLKRSQDNPEKKQMNVGQLKRPATKVISQKPPSHTQESKMRTWWRQKHMRT